MAEAKAAAMRSTANHRHVQRCCVSYARTSVMIFDSINKMLVFDLIQDKRSGTIPLGSLLLL